MEATIFEDDFNIDGLKKPALFEDSGLPGSQPQMMDYDETPDPFSLSQIIAQYSDECITISTANAHQKEEKFEKTDKVLGEKSVPLLPTQAKANKRKAKHSIKIDPECEFPPQGGKKRKYVKKPKKHQLDPHENPEAINAIKAKRSRERKRQEFLELEGKVVDYEEKNKKLQVENNTLKKKNILLKAEQVKDKNTIRVMTAQQTQDQNSIKVLKAKLDKILPI